MSDVDDHAGFKLSKKLIPVARNPFVNPIQKPIRQDFENHKHIPGDAEKFYHFKEAMQTLMQHAVQDHQIRLIITGLQIVMVV